MTRPAVPAFADLRQTASAGRDIRDADTASRGSARPQPSGPRLASGGERWRSDGINLMAFDLLHGCGRRSGGSVEPLDGATFFDHPSCCTAIGSMVRPT